MFKTGPMRFDDIRQVTVWCNERFGPWSDRWNIEYGGSIGNVSVQVCFQDKRDMELFLDTWDSRA